MLPLYLAGEVNWLTSQSFYHGLPLLHEEGIILCWPREPYVSLGCHQDWNDFDDTSGIAVVRRKVGGSLVYLDPQQVFFQIVLDPSNHPRLKTPDQWYRFALAPVVSCLRHWGLDAVFKFPADILINDRKISGNAGGQIEDSVVVVGNILLSFSPAMMAQVRAGTQEFKRAFAESMSRHLVTLGELRPAPYEKGPTEVMHGLAQFFAQEMGAERQALPWNRWEGVFAQVGRRLTRSAWLHARGYRPPYHQVKVREGIYLRQPREEAFSGIIAEVDTENKMLTGLWNSPRALPLPLRAQTLVDYVPDLEFRRVLGQLLDVSLSNSSSIVTS